ncbi:hypothetical protein KP77_25060 [Jeotgalibacillus alimentarius]|uniref:DUF7210 domain-containing protein n=1 Tax=Jeotgalibacillus alimentarius TaxID=135826 RepID=A0A0C2VDB3_9BACL|nr:hypothetical protein [Jeotgalibacillus alimentarius]KIL46937.1 hypothetical protein KP77_25060 [Jeotgalibacillus alimentarius]
MDVKVSAVVKHNGKWFKSGDELKKIKKEDGKRLIDLGVGAEIEESEAEKKAREKAEKEAAAKAEAEAKQKAEEEAKAKEAADKKAAEEKAKADEAEKGK